MIQHEITAGATLEFRTTVADYPPAGGWTLKFRLVPFVTGAAIDITAADGGDGGYLVQVSPTVTAAWAAGRYSWASWVELAANAARYTVDSGILEILANPTTATAPLDRRTTARKTLEAIDAAILGSASVDQLEYTIGNRTLKRIPKPDLLKFRAFYAEQVASEDAAERLAAGIGASANKLRVRF